MDRKGRDWSGQFEAETWSRLNAYIDLAANTRREQGWDGRRDRSPLFGSGSGRRQTPLLDVGNYPTDDGELDDGPRRQAVI